MAVRVSTPIPPLVIRKARAHVASTTRERDQAVLDERNYRPNLAARQPRSARTGLIALAVPELDLPYFAELARHVAQAAESRGWTVLIDQTDGRPGCARGAACGG